MAEPTEERARALRDFVFESSSGDKNWKYCQENWTRPDTLKWLEEQAALIKARMVRKMYG